MFGINHLAYDVATFSLTTEIDQKLKRLLSNADKSLQATNRAATMSKEYEGFPQKKSIISNKSFVLLNSHLRF